MLLGFKKRENKLIDPLERILDWFDSQPDEVRLELVTFGSHFHFRRKIRLITNEKRKVRKFRKYLMSSRVYKSEVVSRTLFIIRLFDFLMMGKETEGAWVDAMDRHLEMRSELREKGKSPDSIDKFLDTYEEQKVIWLESCAEWSRLKENELSNEQIMHWYLMAVSHRTKNDYW